MSGPIPIHNVPAHLNLPERANRDPKQQRRKPGQQATENEADPAADDSTQQADTAPSSDNSQDSNHVGTQIDVEV
jgi:hypothetical protein